VTSDSVILVSVVCGSSVGVGVGVTSDETGLNERLRSPVTRVEATEMWVRVLSVDTVDGGKDIFAGSKGSTRSGMIGMLDSDETLLTLSLGVAAADGLLSGKGTSSGLIDCSVEHISAVVYSVETSVGQISAETYSVEHTSAVSYSHSDGMDGKDSKAVEEGDAAVT
jgi:hypothetical protein